MTTPASLLSALRPVLGEAHDEDAPALLAMAERAADTDPGLEWAVGRCRAWLEALQAVPPGTTLVAWDRWTVTWDDHDPHRGGGIRCRSALREDPMSRRSLVRQGRHLAELGLPVHTDHLHDRTALVVAGLPFDDAEQLTPPRFAPLLLDLRALHAAGLSPAEPAAALLSTESGPRLLPLSVEGADHGTALARMLAPLQTTPELESLLSIWRQHPPGSPDEAEELLRDHLRAELIRLHHELVGRGERRGQQDARQRLMAALAALAAAAPPPRGRGAVGVGLDGEILVLECDGAAVRWGPLDGAQETVFQSGELEPRGVRRLLRARAAAPPNATLDARVGGDGAAVEAICRWLSTAARLRTLRLLLEKQA